MNNNLQGIKSSRLDEAKNQVIDLDYKETKKQSIRTEKRKKNPKTEDNIRNFKHSDICIMEVPEGEERARN